MANPASVYCAAQGGKLSIENQSAGQVGICTLPDGTQIEEWALYRRDHPPK
jgi:putative hemolysin